MVAGKRSLEFPAVLVNSGAGVPISSEALIFVALVIFAGYMVFGVTGSGASPITIPVLGHVLPLTSVLSLASVLDLGAALALGFHTRRQADARELVTLLPFTLVGLTLGVTLLVNLPRNATLLALGLFVCAYALYVMPRRDTARRLSRRWAAPAGVAGGVLAPCSASAVRRTSCTSPAASPNPRRNARRSRRW